MKNPVAHHRRVWPFLPVLFGVCLVSAHADPIPVRHAQGTVHGFLALRAEDGHIVASGDVTLVVHGEQVTSHTWFTFKDGSIDDEVTVFSQRGTLHLITDHHVQKGPSFPHPMDMLIDTRSGLVTTRSVGKDGKEEVKTAHPKLPPDLANGIVPNVLVNLPPHAKPTTVSMLIDSAGLRVVKLAISKVGEDPYSVEGTPHKALHYEIKIIIGGIAGIVAPFVGKAPPNIELWTTGEPAPTFLRELGPSYPEGPTMTIQLLGPVWP